MNRTITRILCAFALSILLNVNAQAEAVVSGVAVDETTTVAGTPLRLNGVGYRKRGYFKVAVTALYLPQKLTSLEAVERATGVKRLELVILKDVTGSQAARHFLSDFEEAATPAEVNKLMSDVWQIGDIYGSLTLIKKGDVFTMDWIPGKGLLAALNGKPLTPHGASSPFMNNELLAKVLFRIYIAGSSGADLRDNLLGLSASMRDK